MNAVMAADRVDSTTSRMSTRGSKMGLLAGGE